MKRHTWILTLFVMWACSEKGFARAKGNGLFDLNLVDHPKLLHRKVVIKGNLATYQLRSGLRNLTRFLMK